MKKHIQGKKWHLGVFAVLLCICLCLIGTAYAWQSISQAARNDVSGDPLIADLTVEKWIENIDGSEPTPEQKEVEFTFIVTFSDGEPHYCQIDDGEPKLIPNNGVFVLKHGQKAVFKDLPVGVTYKVEEVAKYLIDAVTGDKVWEYYVLGSGHTGTITSEGAYALFRNIYQFEPTGKDGHLTVKKIVEGYPEDPDKEYEIILIVDGKREYFTLKADEMKEFVIPEGSRYEIREKDYSSEGFETTITNGFGTMLGDTTVECIVTNKKAEESYIEYSGEKFWVLNGADESVIPEYILVYLMLDDTIIDYRIVSKNADGRWLYTFDEVPEFDEDGNKILYYIKEEPLDDFRVSYNEVEDHVYHITNTYIPKPTVVLPNVEKQVQGENAPTKTFTFTLNGLDGAPMPGNAESQTIFFSIEGNGTWPLGQITFEQEGTYVYTLEETQWDWEYWTMDTSVYTLIYEVTKAEDGWNVTRTIKKDGIVIENIDSAEKLSRLLFTNIYENPEIKEEDVTVIISGQKYWAHRSNMIKDWPTSVTIYIYADGTYVKTVIVTEEDDWKYMVELPRYAEDGHIINYTISEKPVPGYDTEIQGFNVVNTYHTEDETTDGPENPEDPKNPEGGTSTTTGDQTPVTQYFIAMMVSFFMIMQMIVLWISEKKTPKNHSDDEE